MSCSLLRLKDFSCLSGYLSVRVKIQKYKTLIQSCYHLLPYLYNIRLFEQMRGSGEVTALILSKIQI